MIRNDRAVTAQLPKVRQETILLVEYDGVIRRMLGNALRMYGYSVLLAYDGDDAINVCKHHLGRIDVAVIDLLIPGVDGDELAGHLTKTRPTLKVMFVSGNSDDLITHRRIDQSAVLQKPFTPSQLAASVEQALEREPCIA